MFSRKRVTQVRPKRHNFGIFWLVIFFYYIFFKFIKITITAIGDFYIYFVFFLKFVGLVLQSLKNCLLNEESESKPHSSDMLKIGIFVFSRRFFAAVMRVWHMYSYGDIPVARRKLRRRLDSLKCTTSARRGMEIFSEKCKAIYSTAGIISCFDFLSKESEFDEM